VQEAAFLRLYPDDGSLQEQMIVEARSCFAVPDGMSDAAAALLEPLGVALHAVDLGKLKAGAERRRDWGGSDWSTDYTAGRG